MEVKIIKSVSLADYIKLYKQMREAGYVFSHIINDSRHYLALFEKEEL